MYQFSNLIGDDRGCRLGFQETYEIKVSIEVSIGFVLRHWRNDPKPGVRANEVDGMIKWDGGICATSVRS